MEVTGLVLAAVATVDLCLKYGRELVIACAAFKHAESQIAERATRVRGLWYQTRVQLDFLRRIWSSLDPEHQALQDEILHVLCGKLQIALAKVTDLSNKLNAPSQPESRLRISRFKFVLVRECLDKTIEGLALWQESFDPSWYLILKIADPMIDRELLRQAQDAQDSEHATSIDAIGFRSAAAKDELSSRPVFLPELTTAQCNHVSHSAARHVQRAGSSGPSEWLIMETLTCDARADRNTVTKDVRTLAGKLSCGDPRTFGILQCKGVVRAKANATGNTGPSFDFAYRIPPEFNLPPVALRSALLSEHRPGLSECFRLAKQIAKAICYVHTLGFVHKNIRPETILAFTNEAAFSGPCFLVGFEHFRTADGRTLKQGDLAWDRNIYRHPDRQGSQPDEAYVMQHDIYSLGVCLLEIGKALGLSPDSPAWETPGVLKQHLVACTEAWLPRNMGDIYTRVVIDCLTCLDKDNVNFGNTRDFEDADGVLIGVRYVEKILLALDSIQV